MARLTKAEIAQNEIVAAELAQAQQAELKRMRAAKRAQAKAARVEAVKPSAAEHAESVQPDPLHAAIDDLFADVEFPSARRVLVGFILGIACSAVVGYGIGMLLAYALAGIMLLTSTAWIAFTLTVLAWIIALYAAWKIGGYVGGTVFSSVVLPTGLAARSAASVSNACGSAKNKIGGWFTSKPVVEAPAFTGAHAAAA
jgi:hypothetical protein